MLSSFILGDLSVYVVQSVTSTPLLLRKGLSEFSWQSERENERRVGRRTKVWFDDLTYTYI